MAEGDRVSTSVLDPTGPPGAPDLTGTPLEAWSLGEWEDATTAIGTTPSRNGSDVDWTTPVLITCTVPCSDCTVLEGTEEGVNLPVDRSFGLPRESSIDPG